MMVMLLVIELLVIADDTDAAGDRDAGESK